MVRSYRLPVKHDDLEPDANGHVLLEDIIYQVIRCSLLHEAALDAQIVLSPTVCIGGGDDGKLIISDNLPIGLVQAVVLNPVNANQRLPNPMRMKIGREQFDVDHLWGKKALIESLIGTGAI